jgi:hypothetical protein
MAFMSEAKAFFHRMITYMQLDSEAYSSILDLRSNVSYVQNVTFFSSKSV